MTFGILAIGFGVALTLMQLYVIAKTSGFQRVSRSMLYVMLTMAFAPPALAYFAFYMIWPELGAKPFSG